jgi:hypothetical protein
MNIAYDVWMIVGWELTMYLGESRWSYFPSYVFTPSYCSFCFYFFSLHPITFVEELALRRLPPEKEQYSTTSTLPPPSADKEVPTD